MRCSTGWIAGGEVYCTCVATGWVEVGVDIVRPSDRVVESAIANIYS